MTERSESHFFGRRKGKQLRSQQSALMDSLLPQLRVNPEDLRQATASPFDELWLEIGFGGGEHLAADARLHPNIRFIGCEPFVNGVAKLLAVIDAERLANIGIHDGDAIDVLNALPEASLDRITILYPDPWPKFRQRKRRIISGLSIELMARALRPGSEVHFATDIDDYSGWTLARFMASDYFVWKAEEASDWTRPWKNWPGTRYEAKAVREGRRPAYLTFVRNARAFKAS
jgi:tRNA (guanine-N7-)-methyltransferase